MRLKKVFKQHTKRQDSLWNITGSYVNSQHAILSYVMESYFFLGGGAISTNSRQKVCGQTRIQAI